MDCCKSAANFCANARRPSCNSMLQTETKSHEKTRNYGIASVDMHDIFLAFVNYVIKMAPEA